MKYQVLFAKVQLILVSFSHFRLVPPHFICSGDGTTLLVYRKSKIYDPARKSHPLIYLKLHLLTRSLSCKRSRTSHCLFLIHLVLIRHFVFAILQAEQRSGYRAQLSTPRTHVRFTVGLCLCNTVCRN